MGIYRHIYNSCVAEWKNQEIKKAPTIKELRDKFVCNDALQNKPWAMKLPWDSRDEACKEFISAVKINWKVYKEKVQAKAEILQKKGLSKTKAKEQASKSVTMFDMKFKSKKRKKTESFFIRERNWNQKNSGVSWLRQIKSKETFDIKYDTRILKNGVGRFYIIVLKPLDPQVVSHKNQIISLDPGERTFLTGYDPEGSVFEFGAGDSDKLIKLGLKADMFQSFQYHKHPDNSFTLNHKKRKNLKKKFQKIKYKIQNKVKDCHHKISSYLVKSYDNVLLPTFGTSEMVVKGNRVIRSKTVRKLLTWSHYKFRQIIQAKSKRFDCFVAPCEEHYTSKGCLCRIREFLLINC